MSSATWQPAVALSIVVFGLSACSRGTAGTLMAHAPLRVSLEHTFSPDAAVLREVAFSPNGRWLATTSVDGMIRLWQPPAWTRGPAFDQKAGVVSVAFSPDSQRVVTGSYDGRVRVWRISDGTLERTLTGHTGTVWSVAVSPDGRLIASGGEDKTVRLWQVADGIQLRALTGHTLNVWCVRFSPDGRTIASGSFDHTARLWRADTGALERTLIGHTEAIVHLAFSPDGRWLATGGDDATVKVWRVANGAAAYTLAAGNHVYGLTFSADGQWLIAGGREKGDIGTLWKGIAGHHLLPHSPTVRIWRVSDRTLVQALADPDDDVGSVAVSPDNAWLAASGEDHVVRLWRLSMIP